MYSARLYCATLFSAAALAQVSIDATKNVQIASEYKNVISSITAKPVFQSDVDAIASVVPSSVVAAAESNPLAFVEVLAGATALPSYASSVPTAALDSLESLAAKPIEIGEDIASYIATVLQDPAFSSARLVLATAIPSQLRPVLEHNPAAFLAGGITASVTPAYLSALPTLVQAQLVNFINGGRDIVASDLAAASTSVSLNQTNSTAGALRPYSTGSQTNAPAAFTGAANGLEKHTMSATAVVAFLALLAIL